MPSIISHLICSAASLTLAPQTQPSQKHGLLHMPPLEAACSLDDSLFFYSSDVKIMLESSGFTHSDNWSKYRMEGGRLSIKREKEGVPTTFLGILAELPPKLMKPPKFLKDSEEQERADILSSLTGIPVEDMGEPGKVLDSDIKTFIEVRSLRDGRLLAATWGPGLVSPTHMLVEVKVCNPKQVQKIRKAYSLLQRSTVAAFFKQEEARFPDFENEFYQWAQDIIGELSEDNETNATIATEARRICCMDFNKESLTRFDKKTEKVSESLGSLKKVREEMVSLAQEIAIELFYPEKVQELTERIQEFREMPRYTRYLKHLDTLRQVIDFPDEKEMQPLFTAVDTLARLLANKDITEEEIGFTSEELQKHLSFFKALKRLYLEVLAIESPPAANLYTLAFSKEGASNPLVQREKELKSSYLGGIAAQ